MTDVVTLVCVSAIGGLAGCVRALPARRLRYWRSWIPGWAVVGVVSTLVVLGLVSAVGVTATHLSGHPGIAEQLVGAAAAQSSARRVGAGSSKRGETMALGLVAEISRWIAEWAENPVQKWAEALEDERLLSAAARLDSKAKGTKASLEQRIEWRQTHGNLLKAGGTSRDTARDLLIDFIVKGYPVYEVERPNG